MLNLLTLAVEESESLELSLGGRLRGIGVVVFAIILFCGSIYLLLATNQGSQLGFLVSLAAVSGFISMLAMIWSTSQFPLNSLHGPPPAWKVKQVTQNLAEADIEQVRNIGQQGKPADTAKAGEIKAAVDTALTAEGEFQTFNTTTEYLAEETFEIGGGGNFIKHKALYAVAEVRPVLKVEALPGQAPPRPRADESKPPSFVVLVRDLGALRLPQYFTVVAFGLIFAISLVLLHKAERAKQTESEGTVEPAPAPA